MAKCRTVLSLSLTLAVAVVLCIVLWDRTPEHSATHGRQNAATGTAAPAPYKRIVCMAPNITEAVFALGCGDIVVGVAAFSDYPPQAKDKPSVGGYINPSFERLIALQPDLVIAHGRAEKVDRFCRNNDISLLRVEMSDIETIYSGVMTLGEALGCSSRAEQLCDEIRRSLHELRQLTTAYDRPRVFLCLGRTSGSLRDIYTVGPSSFLSELIEVAGGENIFDEVTLEYPQISKESLQKRRPEIIIEPRPGQDLSTTDEAALRSDWQRMADLPAVKTGRILVPTDDYLLIAGPRVHKAAWRMAQLIHPELLNADAPK